jgi:hypothetical protein
LPRWLCSVRIGAISLRVNQLSVYSAVGGAFWLTVSIDCWSIDTNRCTLFSFVASLWFLVAFFLYSAAWFLGWRRGDDTMFGRNEMAERSKPIYRIVVLHVDFVLVSNILFFIGIMCDLLETILSGVLRRYQPADTLFVIGNACWGLEAYVELLGCLVDMHHRRVLHSEV